MRTRFPLVPKAAWLGEEFDQALVGVAWRCREDLHLPVYSIRSLVRWFRERGFEAADCARQVQQVMAPQVGGNALHRPLFLGPVNPRLFWARVRDRELRVWEKLDAAILGVAVHSSTAIQDAVVYTLYRTFPALADIHEASRDEMHFGRTFWEQNLKDVQLGPATPWWLTAK